MDVLLLSNDQIRVRLWEYAATGIYIVYFIATVQLIPQLRGLIGGKGVSPIQPRLNAYKRDFPGWRHLAYLPTYLWISTNEYFMLGLLWVGSASSLYIVFFGVNHIAMFLCWSIYVSFVLTANLMLPWDNLLCEVGFLALFLPSRGLPHPVVAFAFRWLMFRLMFGFGKTKFLGSTKNDNLYLREFCTAQPIPSRCGFYMQRLPDYVHKVNLLLFFIAEVPVPFGYIYPVSWAWGPQIRVASAIITFGLQLAISLMGNFGFFNFLSVVLCIPLLDVYSEVPSLSEMSHVLVLLFPLSLLTLVWNSWLNQIWWIHPTLRFCDPVRRFYRFLQPLFIVNCYGVFPPHSFPRERFATSIEGSADGKTWLEYEFKYLNKLPWFLSPYHPRIEYTFFYIGVVGIDNLFFYWADPYRFSKFPYHHRIAQRLLEGSPDIRKIFAIDPFSTKPPKFVRIVVNMLEPQTYGTSFYKKTYMHVHLPPVQSKPHLWSEYISAPQEWHVDALVWHNRYERHLGEAKLKENSMPLFWEFTKQYQFDPEKCEALGWDTLMRSDVQRFRTQYTNTQQRQIENELGKYTWMLMKKLDPMLNILTKATPCSNYTFLGLLAHIIVSKGYQEIEECMRPGGEKRIERIAKQEFSLDSGMYLFTLLSYELVKFQAMKFRLLSMTTARDGLPLALEKFFPGFLTSEFFAWLTKQFIPTEYEDEEQIPIYSYNEKGMVLKGVKKLKSLEDLPPPIVPS